MQSDYNLKTAKDIGLIFSLLDVTSVWEVSFSYVQNMLHGLTSVILCVPFISADSEVFIWW